MPPRRVANSRTAPSPARSTRSVARYEEDASQTVRNDGLLGFKDTSVNIAAAFHAAQTRKPRSSALQRAVSPVEQLAESARALSPVRYFLRPGDSNEDGEYSSFSTFEQPSYDYQQEEEWVRAVQAKTGDGKTRKKVTKEDMPYRPGSDSGDSEDPADSPDSNPAHDSGLAQTPARRPQAQRRSPTPVQQFIRALSPRPSPAPRTFQSRRKPSSLRTLITNLLHGVVLALRFIVDTTSGVIQSILRPTFRSSRAIAQTTKRDWWKWLCGFFVLSLALRLGKRHVPVDYAIDHRILALERALNHMQTPTIDHEEIRHIATQAVRSQTSSHDHLEQLVRRLIEEERQLRTSKAEIADVAHTGDIQHSVSDVQDMIDAALLRYSKDTLARTDYALFTAGGRVVPSITSDTLVLKPVSALSKWLGGKRDVEGRPPATALHPDTSVGSCWPFQGGQGQLGVLLSRRAVITEITVEHAAKELALDVSTAPKAIEVWGVIESESNRAKVDNASHVLLASVIYDPDATPIQTFSVSPDIIKLGIDVGIVIFRVESNWGGEFTCLYRVRVHGDVVAEAMADAMAEAAADGNGMAAT